jgi:hypothetical protein
MQCADCGRSPSPAHSFFFHNRAKIALLAIAGIAVSGGVYIQASHKTSAESGALQTQQVFPDTEGTNVTVRPTTSNVSVTACTAPSSSPGSTAQP